MNNNTKAEDAFYDARDGINVKENEKIVLKCKKIYWCYRFALDVPGANIKAHEKVILELEYTKYSYYFARDVLGANIEEHFKVIYNSGNKYWLNFFIEEVNYKNTKVEVWLLYI